MTLLSFDGKSLLLDRARNTLRCVSHQLILRPRHQGWRQKSTRKREAPSTDPTPWQTRPVDREEEEETAAWEGEVTIWFAERVGGALDNYGQL